MSRKKLIQDIKKFNEIISHKYQSYKIGDMVKNKKTNSISMIVEVIERPKYNNSFVIMELDTGKKKTVSLLHIGVEFENLTEEKQ